MNRLLSSTSPSPPGQATGGAARYKTIQRRILNTAIATREVFRFNQLSATDIDYEAAFRRRDFRYRLVHQRLAVRLPVAVFVGAV
jgi:hypothetical protein